MPGTPWSEAKTFFERNAFWKGVNHPIALARLFRKYLLETREHQCAICKRTEWQGQNIPLVMDHEDGNSQNWSLPNLRLICGNCDMLLPTFKNKNRGKGRGYRRERYRTGKKY